MRHGLVALLIPPEHRPGEKELKGHEQQTHTDQIGDGPGRPISARKQYPQHVGNQQGETEIGTPVMKRPDGVQTGGVANVVDAGVGHRRGRVVKLG